MSNLKWSRSRYGTVSHKLYKSNEFLTNKHIENPSKNEIYKMLEVLITE